MIQPPTSMKLKRYHLPKKNIEAKSAGVDAAILAEAEARLRHRPLESGIPTRGSFHPPTGATGFVGLELN